MVFTKNKDLRARAGRKLRNFSAKIFFNRKAEDEEEEEPKTIICVTQPKTPKRINCSLFCNYQVK